MYDTVEILHYLLHNTFITLLLPTSVIFNNSNAELVLLNHPLLNNPLPPKKIRQ